MARLGPWGGGQGGRRPCRGLQEAVHSGRLGGGVDRIAGGGVVRSSVPAGGRVPGPETAAGVGGVPGVDQEPDRADEPGPVGDDEPAAAGPVPTGGTGVCGLVVAAALGPEEGPTERPRRGAVTPAASPGDPATSIEVAGRGGGSGVSGANIP